MSYLANEMDVAQAPERLGVTTTSGPLLPGLEQQAADESESLFERFAWLYIFCREKLFRDDTKRIVTALWPQTYPAKDEELIELGCGPGFYSCGLAARFPRLSVLGVDRSPKQLEWARRKARSLGLTNCKFERVNVLALSSASERFDALLASRLLTILPAREKVVGEMFRILRPGGRCFVAEPRYTFWASLPLFAMWMLASLTHYENGYREPRRAMVLSHRAFENLFVTQPWKRVSTWRDGRYQYALCEKG
jgi:ubiquinone/menaquinone biosynthesis C-methylase UbiE